MVEITFIARGDSSTANNAALNVQDTNKTPTTSLTFQSGENGDIQLDFNGGQPDPDTTVLINGVSQSFTVEFSGSLPQTGKLGNVNGVDLRGEQIAVITVADGQRYFFLTDGSGTIATMSAFPNGAHVIGNFNTTSKVMVCFARGTQIRTPQGEVCVEALQTGDKVLTADGQAVSIVWISRRTVSIAELVLQPKYRPIRIRKDSFGAGLPRSDLRVSPLHRVLASGWEVELLFGEPEMLVAAGLLVNDTTITREAITGPVEYFHILFERHEVVSANGLGAESLYPGETALAGLSIGAVAELELLGSDIGMSLQDYGPMARPVMSARDAKAWCDFCNHQPGVRPHILRGSNPAVRQSEDCQIAA